MASLSSRGRDGTIRLSAPAPAIKTIRRDGGITCRSNRFSATRSSHWPRSALYWALAKPAHKPIRPAISLLSSRSRRAASPIRWRGWSAKAWARSWDARSLWKIAAGRAATSPPRRSRARRADGYTLLVTTTAVAINETLRPNKGFAANDLKPIAIVASSPEVVRHQHEQSGRQPRRVPESGERQEHHLRIGRRRQRLAYRGRIFLQGDRQD